MVADAAAAFDLQAERMFHLGNIDEFGTNEEVAEAHAFPGKLTD